MKPFTDLENERAWQHHRRHYLCASEVAAIAGLDEYRGALSIYERKVGDSAIEEGARPSVAMRRGKALEPLMQELTEEKLGYSLIDPGEFAVVVDGDAPLSATPDRVSRDSTRTALEYPEDLGLRVHEFKDFHPLSKKNWESGPPPAVLIQVHAQVACMGDYATDGNTITVLFGGEDQYYPVDRDEDMMNGIRELAEQFMGYVRRREPPPVDGLESTTETILRMCRERKDSIVELPESFIEVGISAKRLKAEIDGLEREKRRLTNEVLAALGDGTFAKLPGTNEGWRLITMQGSEHLQVPSEFAHVLSGNKVPYERKERKSSQYLRYGRLSKDESEG